MLTRLPADLVGYTIDNFLTDEDVLTRLVCTSKQMQRYYNGYTLKSMYNMNQLYDYGEILRFTRIEYNWGRQRCYTPDDIYNEHLPKQKKYTWNTINKKIQEMHFPPVFTYIPFEVLPPNLTTLLFYDLRDCFYTIPNQINHIKVISKDFYIVRNGLTNDSAIFPQHTYPNVTKITAYEPYNCDFCRELYRFPNLRELRLDTLCFYRFWSIPDKVEKLILNDPVFNCSAEWDEILNPNIKEFWLNGKCIELTWS